MSETITPDQIIEAVRASGYLMEQEVASLLENAGFLVTTNWAFEDQDEGTSRELDVHAYKMLFQDRSQGVYLTVELLCSCKKSESPLVFLGRQKNKADPHHVPTEYVFPFDNYEKELPRSDPRRQEFWADPPWRHLGLAKHHYFYGQGEKAVQFCRIAHNNKKLEANHGGVYDSLIYPIVKAVHAKRTQALDLRKHMKGHVWLFFPVVVVNGPLYYIDTQAPSPTPILREYISFMRRFDAKTLKGQYLVDFVTMAHLVSFVEHCILPFAGVVAEIARQSPRTILQSRIARGDWDGVMTS